MPNISYLSHVVRVDDDHVAVSNQFFAKTAANIRANPQATLILVDCFTGDQFLLDISFTRSLDTGPLFEKIALQLKASSAQVGMADIMRLRSADVYRVLRIEREAEAEEIIESLLRHVQQVLGFGHALVLIQDSHRDHLVTTGSQGYERTGLGSEVMRGEGLIGAAAASGQSIKVSDMSRVRRFGEAIIDAEGTESATRSIALPHLPTTMSQIAVPLIARGVVTGVLFVESTERMTFRAQDEAALEILAGAAANALAANALAANDGEVASAEQTRDAQSVEASVGGRSIRVVHHQLDNSVFVDGTYIVKGIAGALLRLMLEWRAKDGRTEFTNREMRLALGTKMPEIKDNLETRLLLLRRRLEEKHAPIQIIRTARGRVRLEAGGPIVLEAFQD